MSRRCACGRVVRTGWADVTGGDQWECLICRTERDLGGVVLVQPKSYHRPLIKCWCCGKVGEHAGDQLIRSCYMREWRRHRRLAK